MKAVVKMRSGVGNVEYTDFPESEPGVGQVKVEVKAAGICGTDLHIYRDEFPYRPPVVLGHEFSGEVVALGPGVTRAAVGDRVMSELPVEPCGQCRYCKTGDTNLCLNRRGLGWSANGVFARYTIIEEKAMHRVPDNLDYQEAAVCEPLAVASYGVIEQTRVSAGDVVYVSGPGPIGLLVAQVAKAAGAYVAIGGTASDEPRLAVARQLDLDRVINIEDEDPVAFLRELTAGLGADVVFECAGARQAAQQCLRIVRKDGCYTQMGLFGRPIELDSDLVVTKGIRVQGVFSSNWRAWDRALRLVRQNRVKLRPIISHCYPLTEWQRAFEMLWRHEGLKILLIPTE